MWLFALLWHLLWRVALSGATCTCGELGEIQCAREESGVLPVQPPVGLRAGQVYLESLCLD